MKALVVYLPVIHKGIVDLCQRQKPDLLCVLGQSLKSDFPLLERDLRALTPEQILVEAQVLSLAPKIMILEKDTLSTLDGYEEIILSEDEVGLELQKIHFSQKKVIFDTTFLRWSGMKALSKTVVGSEQTVSSEQLDQELLQGARDSAVKSPDWWRQVGSVIVKDGKIILSGYNKHSPTEQTSYIDGDPRSNFNAGEHIELSLALHGEAGLIAYAARKGVSLSGSSIYVTTFPCSNCAMLIVQAGIKKVYYADGYSQLNAQEMFKNAGVALIQVIETKRPPIEMSGPSEK